MTTNSDTPAPLYPVALNVLIAAQRDLDAGADPAWYPTSELRLVQLDNDTVQLRQRWHHRTSWAHEWRDVPTVRISA